MSLVLTQRVGIDGEIHIINEETGEHMAVSVVNINGGQVKLSFTDFPNHYSIQRDTVYQRGNHNVN